MKHIQKILPALFLLLLVLFSAGVAEEAAVLSLPADLTVIGEEAFLNDTSLDRVNIPKGTTTIESHAFAGSSVQHVTLPESLTFIAGNAFENCTGMTATVTEHSYAHGWCIENSVQMTILPAPNPASHFTYNLSNDGFCTITGYVNSDPDVIIPAVIEEHTVTDINYTTFFNNKTITSVTIPEGVTSLSCTFYGCTSLTNVVLPESLRSIGQETFTNCESLTTLTLPKNVQFIDPFAFLNDCGITEFIVDEGSEYLSAIDGVLYSADGRTLLVYPSANEREHFIIPDGVAAIGERAFCDRPVPTEITIPKSVLTIANNAFDDRYLDFTAYVWRNSAALEYCEARSINYELMDPLEYTYKIVDGAVTITGYTGSDTVITIPSEVDSLPVTAIGDNAFDSNSAITSVTIPEGVTKLGQRAFYSCAALTGISLPSTLTDMGYQTFLGCSALTAIDIPAAVKTVPYYCFGNCTSLASVSLPEGLTELSGLPSITATRW